MTPRGHEEDGVQLQQHYLLLQRDVLRHFSRGSAVSSCWMSIPASARRFTTRPCARLLALREIAANGALELRATTTLASALSWWSHK